MAKRRGASTNKRAMLWRGSKRRIGRLVACIAIAGAIVTASALLMERRFAAGADSEEAPSPLRITELMSDNRQTLITDSGEAPDWIEIGNASGEPVELSRWSLARASNINDVFRFPGGELAPGEYVVIYANGDRAAGAPFKLPASGGDALVLFDARGEVADAVELPELSADESYLRGADGAWEVSRTPSPGAAEPSEAPGDEGNVGPIEFTEAMSGNRLYCPDEDGDCCDYVELHNASGESVDLEGWHLSDDSSRLKRWTFPAVTLPPDGYLIVYCSDKDRTGNASHLHTDFKLSGDGEDIYLSDPAGRMAAHVRVPQLSRDQAWSLSEGTWSAELGPTPGRENSRAAAARVQSETFGAATSGVCLNEIMASPSDEPQDWVELYNGSAQTVDLSGYGLSDDTGRPRRWQFPAGTVIQPGGYLGVFLTGDASAAVGSYLCADFALNKDGGYTVCLSDPQGRILDAAYLGEQYGGVAYARMPGQDGFRYCAAATPLAANAGESFLGRAPMAEASEPGGLYHSGERTTVELRAGEGYRIYYTLDGSDPDESAALYTGPIEIYQTTVLRSRVYRDDCMPSYIASQSFLYDVDVPEGVYVVSITTDPDNLYSDSRGILAKGPHAWDEFPYGSLNKGANFWMDWEREANVEVFESDGGVAFSQPCGIKLHGQFSRANTVKAFKVIARSEYGKSRFEYPLFSGRDYESYQSFVLRASGQDYNMTFMRDSVLTQLAQGSSLMYQESELCVCYINGEYYSLFNLRERVNPVSICQFEGWEGMEDDIDLVKANSRVMQGSDDSMEELLDWVRHHDMTTQEAYDYIGARIDVQNYIEYMTFEIFSGNTDLLNVKRYRNPKGDGKWRWVLFDLDWAFYTDTNSVRRWLTPGGVGEDNQTDNTLFVACMKNPIFRDQFLTYFGEQLATTLTAQNVTGKFNERLERLRPLLPDYLKRIGLSGERYQQRYGDLIRYAEERPEKLLKYFGTVYDFSDEQWQHYFGDAIRIVRQDS